MKKSTFLVAILLAFQGVAQKNFLTASVAQPIEGIASTFEYTVAVDTAVYADISGGIDITQGMIWDDPNVTIPIGFGFSIMGEVIDSLFFGAGTGSIIAGFGANSIAQEIKTLLPFAIDIIDRGTIGGTSVSRIYYQTTGTPGNRVFTVEWNNVGFYGEIFDLSSNDDYTNFQMRLFEANGVIEYHFGESNVASPNSSYEGFPGPPVGLLAIDTNSFSFTRVHLLEGFPTAPVLSDTVTAILGTIPNGTRYTFTPIAFGIEENQVDQQVWAYPNPVLNTLHLHANGQLFDSYEIVDLTGKTLARHSAWKQGGIDVSTLKTGMYFLRLSNSGKTRVLRFMKR
jgi:hypothetical protein